MERPSCRVPPRAREREGGPVQGTTLSLRRVGGTGSSYLTQRQRIDMISPRIIAPKPMAKFHADNDTMSGIRSPAT
jgi:hypothetical protein